MEQLKTEFIETLKRLVVEDKNLAINSFHTWDIYGFHFEEFGAMCPVCEKRNSRWVVTYQYKGTIQRCSVCNKCARVVKNNINDMIRSYLILKTTLDERMARLALDYCFNAKVIDTKGYQAYIKINDFSPTIRLSEKQIRLIRAVNYQFVKLIRERMPNKDKSNFSEEFFYLPL